MQRRRHRPARRRSSSALLTPTLVLSLATLVIACSEPAKESSAPVVTVFGSVTDRDADAFIASMTAFERSSGIDVRYVGSANFETDLLERVRRGDPPDLALLPQPGLLRALAAYDPRLIDVVLVALRSTPMNTDVFAKAGVTYRA